MPRRKADPALPFRPFAEDAGVQTFAGFSIENGTRRIALHGSLDLTRDRAGLKRAKALKSLLDAVVATLEAEDLPDAVPEEPETAEPVRNPFA
ncbi:MULTISPECIES: hypothetical protein [Methylorubrum]|jgi:hypothetical protein|uniref:Uncharacterized protein n=3 Tax=Methylorubrum extorquens TaxID=408 RepID=C5B1L8_METEA|nr:MULTISPECIES: hypothetical protein [Methylorubrum]KQP96935.1 hypothetical protein ASF59_11055 [Methylobacterium sp. Leaf121]ACS39652.1 conserved hypothetical protein [Methylorubrum extorquens AM1]EHP83375.1 hypothetical protein MetexDRAFT_6169 [Methylorubrum extorquens DSM 13060]MCP1542226.1 hypothetical protein [Methylorubrum extorquens]MCP1590429.1 hypothetical protein [Methylorubrum extorquens]